MHLINKMNSDPKLLIIFFIVFLFFPFSLLADEKHELEKAFYKEYTFLLKEKKSLENRLKTLKSENELSVSELKLEIDSLKEKSFQKELEIQRINEMILTVDKESIAKETNANVFSATLEQANVTLHPNTDQKEETVDGVVSKSLELLRENTNLRAEEGKYYLMNGSQVNGQVIYLGGVARFGLSDEGSGPLAPAGGGAFKLWQTTSTEKIQSLAQGVVPENLDLFIYDSPTKEVKIVEDKEIIEVIASGGVVAWVIVVLGGVAILLASLKALFLIGLGNSSKKVMNEISESVANSDLERAKELSQGCKGSIKRVVQSTLRNITRDREHVEDAISEAILHEHTSLDRFQAQIMIIAAISPLLGLLGTVTGMIETFDIITEFGTGDPKLLSGGISIALVTTELGLIVAIPVLVIGTMLSVWSNKIKDNLEKSALHIVNQYHNHKSQS